MFPGLLEILFKRRRGSIFTPFYKFLVAVAFVSFIMIMMTILLIGAMMGVIK